MHFFDPDKNGEKFKYQLPIKADPVSKGRRKTRAESIPTDGGREQMPLRYWENYSRKAYFYYFKFPRPDIRSLKRKRVGIGDG